MPGTEKEMAFGCQEVKQKIANARNWKKDGCWRLGIEKNMAFGGQELKKDFTRMPGTEIKMSFGCQEL